MDTAIIDASVAVKWFLREDRSDVAKALAISSTTKLAPDLLRIEVANALRKAVMANQITRAHADRSLAVVRGAFGHFLDSVDLLDDAFDIAVKLRHPIYDCIYLAASRQNAAPLITADVAFIAKLAGTPDAPNAILLSDWKP